MGNWLRDHFYRFVYPALCCAKANTYSANANSIKTFFPVEISAKDYKFCAWWDKLPPELAKLRALCDQLQIGWSSCNYSQGWRANLHFDVMRETLISAERRRKTLGCDRLLLAGRDVWVLEVMAKRRGIDTLFLPEISRNVASFPNQLKAFLIEKGFTGNELLVDTGFVGSIPKKIDEAMGTNLKFVLMSQEKKFNYLNCSISIQDQNCIDRPNQVFPQRRLARKEALETEYLPKYWKTGTVKYQDGVVQVVQFLSEPQEIVLAAILTSDIWRGVKYGRVKGQTKHKKGGNYNDYML